MLIFDPYRVHVGQDGLEAGVHRDPTPVIQLYPHLHSEH